jgi:hypothetical protein
MSHMPLTRRLFAQSLAGVTAAWGSTTGFVKYSVLRRPHNHVELVPARHLMLLDCLYIQAECEAALRISVRQQGAVEDLLQVSVVPRNRERFLLLGVHGYRAEAETTVTIESRKQFRVIEFSARFMHPPFYRQDGMIHYLNPALGSHPETPGFGWSVPHHRKLYGSGKDVGYLG